MYKYIIILFFLFSLSCNEKKSASVTKPRSQDLGKQEVTEELNSKNGKDGKDGINGENGKDGINGGKWKRWD